MNIYKLFLCALLTAFLFSGCGPSYPKENLEKEIVKLCKNEYKIDIKSKVLGKTLAVFIPLKSLLDIDFGINEKAMDTIQDVVLSTTRVALSSDADLQFYCVIAQDIKLPELQVIIIRYIEDVKRAFFMDISRDESLKRMLFDMSINPQARKEEKIREIFKEHSLDSEQEEQLLDDFFRSPPSALKDFGYWQDRFFVRDISFPEFLAEQMAYRIKISFRDKKELNDKFLFRKVEAIYEKQDLSGEILLTYDIPKDEVLVAMGEKIDDKLMVREIVQEVSDTVYDYKFQDFKDVKIKDLNSKLRLNLTKDDIYAFKKNKMTMDAILGKVAL